MLKILYPGLKAVSRDRTPGHGPHMSLIVVASQEPGAKDVGEYFVPMAKRVKASKNAENQRLTKEL